MCLLFVAADTYNQSLCQFYSVANVNSFWRHQLSLAWQFTSVSSSAGMSLNTSNQDVVKNMTPMTADFNIWYMLNDDVVAGLSGLVPDHLLQSHYL